jgi:hypothetical protein
MKRTLLGAFLGLLVGSLFGCVLALAFSPQGENDSPEDGKGWAGHPPLGQFNGPILWQRTSASPHRNYFLFQGILLGGGFGSVVGAVSVGTGVIIRVVERTRPG